MLIKIIENIIRFVFLILIQVWVLNHIQWSGYINPYVYILFIMLLPLETPNWLVMVLGFVTGATIDMFSNTGGIHAASTVFMAFTRPGILKLISPRDGYESEVKLTAFSMGLKWFITYCFFLVALHHLALFYLEVFRFSEFIVTFAKALLNILITLILILSGHYLFNRQGGIKNEYSKR
jgi:rod shape-determining protein MreD